MKFQIDHFIILVMQFDRPLPVKLQTLTSARRTIEQRGYFKASTPTVARDLRVIVQRPATFTPVADHLAVEMSLPSLKREGLETRDPACEANALLTTTAAVERNRTCHSSRCNWIGYTLFTCCVWVSCLNRYKFGIIDFRDPIAKSV